MPLKVSSLQSEIENARETLQRSTRTNPPISENDMIRVLMEAEIRNLKEQQNTPIDKQVGYDELNVTELEAITISELENTCKELEYSQSFYQNSLSNIMEENESLKKQQEDLSEIYKEFQKQSSENSRQIESMQAENSTIYESKVESFKRDTNQLRRANRILITEIKDLLSICYGNRRSKVDEDVLLSKEILTILEDCIKRALSKDTADKYITVTPEVAEGEAIQLLLTANLIQRDRSSQNRFCIIDFFCYTCLLTIFLIVFYLLRYDTNSLVFYTMFRRTF